MAPTPVEVRRAGPHHFVGRNPRGGEVHVGADGAANAFTPGELLLVAAAACAAVTAENLIIRRLGDEAELSVSADRTKETEDAHEFTSVSTAMTLDLSTLAPDQREALVQAVRRAVANYCTVSRTLERGVPVSLSFP
jgi:uncharacterized OsmC-like protein